MAMNGNEGGSAYPPNPDVKSGSCLIAGFQPLTVVHPTYWNAYKTESGATFSIDMVRLKLSFINGKGEWLSTRDWVRVVGIMLAEKAERGEEVETLINMLGWRSRPKVREYLRTPMVELPPDCAAAAVAEARSWCARFE